MTLSVGDRVLIVWDAQGRPVAYPYASPTDRACIVRDAVGRPVACGVTTPTDRAFLGRDALGRPVALDTGKRVAGTLFFNTPGGNISISRLDGGGSFIANGVFSFDFEENTYKQVTKNWVTPYTSPSGGNSGGLPSVTAMETDGDELWIIISNGNPAPWWHRDSITGLIQVPTSDFEDYISENPEATQTEGQWFLETDIDGVPSYKFYRCDGTGGMESLTYWHHSRLTAWDGVLIRDRVAYWTQKDGWHDGGDGLDVARDLAPGQPQHSSWGNISHFNAPDATRIGFDYLRVGKTWTKSPLPLPDPVSLNGETVPPKDWTQIIDPMQAEFELDTPWIYRFYDCVKTVDGWVPLYPLGSESGYEPDPRVYYEPVHTVTFTYHNPDQPRIEIRSYWPMPLPQPFEMDVKSAHAVQSQAYSTGNIISPTHDGMLGGHIHQLLAWIESYYGGTWLISFDVVYNGIRSGLSLPGDIDHDAAGKLVDFTGRYAAASEARIKWMEDPVTWEDDGFVAGKRYVGKYDTVEDLPESPTSGDYAIVEADGKTYVYDAGDAEWIDYYAQDHAIELPLPLGHDNPVTPWGEIESSAIDLALGGDGNMFASRHHHVKLLEE